MAYVEGFTYDVFISYAHLDNQADWVTEFERKLNIRLGELLGKDPEIWRDATLQGNEYFEETIPKVLSGTAVLVSVLTPRYVNSEWCLREVELFMEGAAKTSGVCVGEKSRLFKVIKTPIPRATHPAGMGSLLGYKFFEIDPKSRAPLEFTSGEDSYVERLNRLAYEICLLLQTMKSQREAQQDDPPAPPTQSGATVYLAETTSDLTEKRDRIRSELVQRGHAVLPDQSLPLVGPDLESLARKALNRSGLSIHLVGKEYGIVPEQADRSVVELQCVLAAERSREDSQFSRLIWLPKGLDITDERQQAFVDALLNDPTVRPGDDLLRTTLEDFKTSVDDKIKAKLRPQSPDRPSPYLYLLCDPHDRENLKSLRDYLFKEEGIEVTLPLFEGGADEVRQDHEEVLTLCDAVLIYYGCVREAWVRKKLRDLRKAPGWGRKKPMIAKAVYIEDPEDPQKVDFHAPGVDEVIRGHHPFSADVLSPFLRKLKMQRGGQTS